MKLLKMGDVLIVIGVVIIAFGMGVFVVSRLNLNANGELIVGLSFPVGAGLFSTGLLCNYRRSDTQK